MSPPFVCGTAVSAWQVCVGARSTLFHSRIEQRLHVSVCVCKYLPSDIPAVCTLFAFVFPACQSDGATYNRNRYIYLNYSIKHCILCGSDGECFFFLYFFRRVAFVGPIRWYVARADQLITDASVHTAHHIAEHTQTHEHDTYVTLLCHWLFSGRSTGVECVPVPALPSHPSILHTYIQRRGINEMLRVYKLLFYNHFYFI